MVPICSRGQTPDITPVLLKPELLLVGGTRFPWERLDASSSNTFMTGRWGRREMQFIVEV